MDAPRKRRKTLFLACNCNTFMSFLLVNVHSGQSSHSLWSERLRDSVYCVLWTVIIWQGSLEINPRVLIGSFLVGILPYGHHKPSILVYDKRQIWKFAAKTAKRKPENTFILRKETTQKTYSNIDQEEYYLQSKFYFPEDLETSEAGISVKVSNWRFHKQTEKWKHKRKTSTDMNPLLRFIEANGLNSQIIESLPASELDHLLWFFYFIFFLWTYAGKMVNTS